MTIGCYREYLQSDVVKLKKYFYALRPILAAKWIVTYRTFPPMVFSKLLELINHRQDVLTEIDRLLTIKATANEAATIATSPILNEFIRSEIEDCERAIKLIPKHETNSLVLNELFKKYVLRSN
jgi:uncharacterized protein